MRETVFSFIRHRQLSLLLYTSLGRSWATVTIAVTGPEQNAQNYLPLTQCRVNMLQSDESISWLLQHGRELLATQGHRPAAQFNPSLLPDGVAAWQQLLLREQLELRWRSRQRFPFPERWLWTERSLAQASDYWSAHYKAALFPKAALVIDACCGAGSDLVALASRGPTIGIDCDPIMCDLAAANCRAHGREVEVEVRTLREDWQPGEAWLSVDPDRRPSGSRTRTADEFSPSLTTVLEVSRRAPGALIKLAPSTNFTPEHLVQIEQIAQRVWLGSLGECRQQLLLLGGLRSGSQPEAVLCGPQGTAIGDASGSHSPAVAGYRYASASRDPVRLAENLQRYVYELHPVLHAAGLHSAWANEHGLLRVGEAHGYFTADHALANPWVQAFEVIDVVPWDDRQLRKWLRQHGYGPVEVKTRGLSPSGQGGVRSGSQRHLQVDANACQRKYSAPAGEPVTLLVTRLAGRIRGIAAKRMAMPMGELSAR